MTCEEKLCGLGYTRTVVMKFRLEIFLLPVQHKTRPEIYVMGDRNPYRITVDQKNSFLYWGEVGPDAPDSIVSLHAVRGDMMK